MVQCFEAAGLQVSVHVKSLLHLRFNLVSLITLSANLLTIIDQQPVLLGANPVPSPPEPIIEENCFNK